ncbi:hypothetical protein SNE40_012631 [Patella caerulea]|uniref:NAD(P)(+)--arginine ADP-ribosyltransferase n=1 Tax=Patella caerulea TaxID=87958 RepID=A0AAN8JS16_PATCE
MSSGLLFRGLLIFIVCAIQSIDSQDGRFCGEIAWTNPCSSVSDGTVGRRKRDSDSSIDEKLSEEANNNSPFALAWNEAEKDTKLPSLMEKYTMLQRSEIKLIMAYTYSIEPYFYKSLNIDCQDFGLDGGKYPQTKKILRNALIRLGDSQPKLPPILYRKQNVSLLANYSSWNQDESRQLVQFTSTSRDRDAFDCDPKKKMLVIFKNPQTGADIADFSDYDEQEILLPLLFGDCYIESVDVSRKEAVVVGPSTSSATQSSNVTNYYKKFVNK